MRRLTVFQEEEFAYGLVNTLAKHGIEADVRTTDQHEVWVLDDDNIYKSQSILVSFKQNPTAGKPQPPPKETKDRARTVDVRSEVFDASQVQRNLTLLILLICCLIFLTSQGGAQFQQLVYNLKFGTSPMEPFLDIANGEIWRLVTPILIHGGWMHIIFNMYWLYQLGTIVETIDGPKKLLILVLVSGALSNSLQAWVSGPHFGGMSGVIYALISYIWAMGRWMPRGQYFLDNGVFGFMMVWLVLCFFGIFGPIANFAHLGGLLVGLAWAKLETQRRQT